jgi:nucleotide-binding universal stress UspA family protein
VLQAGDPAERICAFAEERDARLIAIGTHGYRPALAMLTGSVSSAVIRRAPCPVLVVREPEEAETVPAVPDRLAASG